MKTLRYLVSFPVIAACVAACGAAVQHPAIQLYPGPEQSSEDVAVIKLKTGGLSLGEVVGEQGQSINPAGLRALAPDDALVLLPGAYRMTFGAEHAPSPATAEEELPPPMWPVPNSRVSVALAPDSTGMFQLAKQALPMDFRNARVGAPANFSLSAQLAKGHVYEIHLWSSKFTRPAPNKLHAENVWMTLNDSTDHSEVARSTTPATR